MTVIDHPAHHLSTVTAGSPGQPGATGRWQPTRAGVVNSWAWAEETLLFADGWLALTGPNGSGKSLTASMLITLLIDGDVSQKALSVSGTAAGTLTSRHTDRNDREDRTGVWWLEYGLRAPETGHTQYLTTGLWLRSVGSEIQRAFFLAPGRVGTDLVLQRDRDPVRIDELAQQLSASEGELFTSSTKLLPKAQAHMQMVAEEADYRRCVRTRLFAPLEEVQFDALVSVLRSLRSVRTAEGISPNQMRAVLSDALPALDTERLTVIAESMERIADLEKQLQSTRAEAAVLDTTDKVYRRYLTSIAQLEAAALSAANNDFDDHARKVREATASLKDAQDDQKELERKHTEARERISELEGQKEAADTALRDHAGAELPHMEQRAEDAAREARDAAERARGAREDAVSATAEAEESARAATSGQRHLTELTDKLRASVTALGAGAAADHLLAAARGIETARLGTTITADIDQLSATPLAWVEARQTQIGAVKGTLRGHTHAQLAEQAAAGILREADAEEDTCRTAVESATGQRQTAEEGFRRALAEWAATAQHLGPIPDELSTSDESAGTDRLELDRLAGWLSESVDAARARIGLPRHQQAAATDAALATSLGEISRKASEEHATAAEAATAAEGGYASAQDAARAEEVSAEETRRQARVSHDEAIASANVDLAAAEHALTLGVAVARREARDWISVVHHWRTRLVHLSVAEPDLPSPESGPAELDTLAPDGFQVLAASAHTKAATRLEHALAEAEQGVRRAEQAVADVETKLAEARRAAPIPAGPPWRTRGPGDGTPLWELVDFAEHLSAADADRLEGALLVSGLLDALVTPDGRAVAGDLTIAPAAPASGRTLADLLRIEPEPTVEAGDVLRLLRALPVDHPGGDASAGTLVNGVLTASAPQGYRAAFIGRTARERSRLARVRDLEGELTAANRELNAVHAVLRNREADIRAARAELDTFPSADKITECRREIDRLRRNLATTETRVSERIGEAELALQRILADLDQAATRRAAALSAAETSVNHALRAATEAGAKAESAALKAAEQAQKAEASERARVHAETAQRQADGERASFPEQQLRQVQAVHQAEDEATSALNRARAALVRATDQHRLEGGEVRNALLALNKAAALPDGSLLPTTETGLGDHHDQTQSLGHLVLIWVSAAHRTTDLLKAAGRAADTSTRRATAAGKAEEEAENRRLESRRQTAAVAEARRLYGAEYETLRGNRQRLVDELADANTVAGELLKDQIEAAGKAAAARTTLTNVAPQRERAEQHRDECLRNLSRLVEEGVASMPEDVPADASGRPANLTAGLTWARRMLADRPAGTDRMTALTQARGKLLGQLETSVRTASAALARFGRQVTLVTIDGTDWRRAIVADPDAARGEDLHHTIEGLRKAADQLEGDLREDVKRAMKTGLFTQLQQDVQLRREAAQELVRKIRETLAGVRTGVASVGVEVDWQVRKDEDAQRMVELVSQPPSDEVYEQMYTVLRQRMDETAGEEWKDRIEHAFDYRSWHDWEIKVTHSSFAHDGQEKFRDVTTRSNPLDSLSTGERRLATMLPLLAAAWSMYSGEYAGPRLLSIDEIDAAFDEPNLRQVLALLRTWQFDVLATAPSMTPMFKQETGRAIIHQVIAAGKHRVTVPWIWEGHGEPQPLTLDFTPGNPREGL